MIVKGEIASNQLELKCILTKEGIQEYRSCSPLGPSCEHQLGRPRCRCCKPMGGHQSAELERISALLDELRERRTKSARSRRVAPAEAIKSNVQSRNAGSTYEAVQMVFSE